MEMPELMINLKKNWCRKIDFVTLQTLYKKRLTDKTKCYVIECEYSVAQGVSTVWEEG